MIRALVWKDLRVNSLPLKAGTAMWLAPYGLAAMIVGTTTSLWDEATPNAAWAVLLATGSYFSVMCSQAALAMLSGHSISAERTDRSAEFLAYLPPSKRQILASKIIVLAGAAAVVWVGSCGVRLFAEWLAGDGNSTELLLANQPPLARLAAIGMAGIGGGWCASAMLESSGPSVTLAFATPLVVLALVSLATYLTGWPDQFTFARVYFTSCTVTGIVLFAAGCVYFLRRIEP